MFDLLDDLNGMFDTDDLAETAIFWVYDQSVPPVLTNNSVPVIYETAEGASGIYDRSFFDEKFYSLIIDTQKNFMLVKTSDCVGVKRNTLIQFRTAGVPNSTAADNWYVFKPPLDDGYGVSILFISKDKA